MRLQANISITPKTRKIPALSRCDRLLKGSAKPGIAVRGMSYLPSSRLASATTCAAVMPIFS